MDSKKHFDFFAEINKKQIYWQVTVALVIITAISLNIYSLLKGSLEKGHIKAMNSGVRVSVLPQSATLPPDVPIQIEVDAASYTVGYAKVVVVFDPTKIQLTSSPILNSSFASLVPLTSMEDANTTGRVIVVAGTPFGATPPTGIISNFLTLTASPVSQVPNDTATFTLFANEMQIVDTTSVSAVPITTNDATFLLNPVDSPTPSESPTPEPSATPSDTPEPSPTRTPTPSNTPTNSPTATRTPTASPTRTPTQSADTQPPTVSMTNPTNGAVVRVSSSVLLQASASDNVGVTKVEFSVGGKIRCTDTVAPYECAWNVSGNPSTYILQAKAYDARNNSAVAQITVTSTR